MRTFTVTFTATVEVDATTPSQADLIVEDSLCQGDWREINALDITDTAVKVERSGFGVLESSA